MVLLNAAFTIMAVYHLAYLGVMFGSQSPEERDLELQVSEYNAYGLYCYVRYIPLGCVCDLLQGFSMSHTLRKWAHLNFLSHWTALASYALYLILG